MGLADQLNEIKKLPKSRLSALENDENESLSSSNPVASTTDQLNDLRAQRKKSPKYGKTPSWKHELEMSAHIDLLREGEEVIISKEKAWARHELHANKAASSEKSKDFDLENSEDQESETSGEKEEIQRRGRPRKKEINKVSLLRLSSPPWFKKVLEGITLEMNKGLSPGQKKWGIGRAVIYIYQEYSRLKSEETRRDQEIGRKILELNIRSLQTRDPDLIDRHGEMVLKRAFLGEVRGFLEILRISGVKEADLKARLSREVTRRYQEVLMHYEVVKREVI